ncbi:FkbM family methyltransferase, partial [Actinomadura soli]
MLLRSYGIARSLVMYYGVPGKHPRATRLYGEFLKPGDLAFDIGAHVG